MHRLCQLRFHRPGRRAAAATAPRGRLERHDVTQRPGCIVDRPKVRGGKTAGLAHVPECGRIGHTRDVRGCCVGRRGDGRVRGLCVVGWARVQMGLRGALVRRADGAAVLVLAVVSRRGTTVQVPFGVGEAIVHVGVQRVELAAMGG